MNDASLRKHIVNLLRGGGAHLSFEQAIADLPLPILGETPLGAAHSAWQVVEHMRIAQWDILEFSRDPKHVSPEFPDAYWPRTEAPPDAAAWERSLALFRADLAAMERLVTDPKKDLLAQVAHPEAKAEHTLLREALLVADHNAYHLGELVLIRRLLRSWNPE